MISLSDLPLFVKQLFESFAHLEKHEHCSFIGSLKDYPKAKFLVVVTSSCVPTYLPELEAVKGENLETLMYKKFADLQKSLNIPLFFILHDAENDYVFYNNMSQGSLEEVKPVHSGKLGYVDSKGTEYWDK